jgi:predicted permease
MRRLRAWCLRFAGLLRKESRDRELAEELESHLQMHIEDNLRSGMNLAEARRQALIKLGGAEQTKENCRDRRGIPWFETTIQDVRYGLRTLWKNPGFTAVAVLTLALGIGATTIGFSVIYAVLINPYPYAGADRIAHLHVFDKTAFLYDLTLSGEQFREFQQAKVLDGAIAMDKWHMSATGTDLPESVSAGHLSPNAFLFFGVPALLGREFSPEDAQDPSDPQKVVVLSYGYWKAHYGNQSNVLGQSLNLDHENYEIIGVTPKRFAWWDCDVYLPLKLSQDPKRVAMVFARIKPGISYSVAEQELQGLMQTLAKQSPDNFPPDFKIHLLRLNDIAVGKFSGTLVALFLAASLLLVIGCANVSILLLARGTIRNRELAIRAAIGASRGRIVRQLLAESATLSLAGSLIGVFLAYHGLDLVSQHIPQGTFPREASFQMSIPVVCFSTALAALTGVLSGLWPALQFSDPPLSQIMQSSSRKLTGSTGSKRSHNILIASQVTLTVVLLTAAGASLKTLYSLLHTRLGYDPRNVISMYVPLSDDGTHTKWQDRVNYFEQIRQQISRTPGVVSVAIATTSLPPMSTNKSSVDIQGRSLQERQVIMLQEISPEYFSTLRIAQLQGRLWTESETLQAAHVAIVNASMARRYWPDSNPVGQRIHLDALKPRVTWMRAAAGNDGWVQVLGVVADTPTNGLRDPVSPTVYVPYTLVVPDGFLLVIRTKGNPLSVVHAVRERIHTVDADQVMDEVRTADQMLDSDGWGREKFTASLFISFGFLGLALAAVGLYSVVSYFVSQKEHEIGIRMALGATKIDIVRMVMKSSLATVTTGLCFGLLISIFLSKLLAHWTEESGRDPMLMIAIVSIVLSAASFASLLPAWRSVRVDPAVALRHD